MMYLVGGLRWLARSSVAAVFAMAALAPQAVQAQESATLTGAVSDEAGQPIDGATVFVTELNQGTLTNAQGRYTIVVPAARVRGQQVTIGARFIGYTAVSQRITLSPGTTETNFSLRQDVNRLSQVVVTGVTGATEVKKLAFTVSQVSSADMPVAGSNVLSQLQGKVAGANIVSASGRPGSAPAIILRGPQSMNASGRGQDPLYIIDGVVSQGGLQDINPQDIENIEVVKGAAAASLYGSRAGNGVINITTRNGKSGSEGVRLRTQVEYGVSSIEREYEYPNTHFMTMNEDMTRYCIEVSGAPNCSLTVDYQEETRRINNNGDPNPLSPVNFTYDGGIALHPGTDGVKLRSLYQVNRYPLSGNPVRQVITNGQTWNGTIDATGRLNRTSFFASLNQLRQEGSLKFQQGYTRNSVRLNLDHQFGNDVDLQFRTNYSEASDFNTGAAWFRVTRQPATADLLARDDMGRLHIRTVPVQQGAQNDNPLYNSENFRPLNRIGRFVGALTLRWRPLTWLDAEAQYGYDSRQNFQSTMQDRGYRTIPVSAANLGNITRSAGRSNSSNASVNVTARRGWFDDALNTRLTFRYLYEEQNSISQEGSGQQLAVPGLDDPDAAITNFSITGGSSAVRQLGMFTNLDVDYKGRYILGFLVRRDAASLFGAANRWQTYGRFSAAWRLSDEPWFNVPMFSDLKLRASQGTAGNRPSFSAQYETFTIGSGGALSAATLGNKMLQPEISTETELGIDMELFNRYGLTLTHAKNVIDQQLLPVDPPAIAGFTSQWQNAGELTNNTFEASLRIPVISRENLNYSVQLNYDRTTSKITRLDIPPRFFSAAGQQGSETMFKYEEGAAFAQIYGRRFVTSCSELPGDFASRCGGNNSAFQKNDDGYIVWVGEGNTQQEGITKNLWMTALPAAEAPWGNVVTNWGLPMVLRDSNSAAQLHINGSALPKYRWSMANTFGYKRLTLYGLIDATVGKSIFNIGRQWSLGDFMHGETDQINKSVENAKPIGYYFRAAAPYSSGIGGLYDVLGPNNNTVEDASFVKLREVTVGYRIGRIAGIGDWNASVIGRNLITFTDYRGFDPEVGNSGGTFNSGALNAIDAFGFPNLRQFTFSLSTSF